MLTIRTVDDWMSDDSGDDDDDGDGNGDHDVDVEDEGDKKGVQFINNKKHERKNTITNFSNFVKINT